MGATWPLAVCLRGLQKWGQPCGSLASSSMGTHGLGLFAFDLWLFAFEGCKHGGNLSPADGGSLALSSMGTGSFLFHVCVSQKKQYLTCVLALPMPQPTS